MKQFPPAPLPVSVVIPAYNSERFLPETLDSIRAQTRPPREVIVVDDGSTDRTPAIAMAAGARVVRQERGGVSAARNRGIEAAREEWIALLDADDLWEPEKLELQWSAVERCPTAGLVATDAAHFDAERTVLRSVLFDRANFGPVTRAELAAGISVCDPGSVIAKFLEDTFIPSSAILVRRSLLHEVGLFDARLIYCEITELLLRLLNRTRLAVVERPLVRIRLHPASASRDETRMLLGAAAVAERVSDNPSVYPSLAADWYARRRPRWLAQAGTRLLASGQFAEARAVLRQSLRARATPRALAAYALSLGGWPLYRGVRAAWRLAARGARAEGP